MNYQTFKLNSQFSIEIDASSLEKDLPAQIREAIEHIWQLEQKSRSVFNGRILDVLSWEPQKLVGRFVEYKSYIAQLRDPSLKAYLPIHILGLTGVTQWQDQYLIGCRAPHVTLYPCCYEFAPAGGFDDTAVEHRQASIAKQLGMEMEEELGISSDDVIEITPTLLMREPLSGDYEICAKIILNPVRTQKIIFPTTEYSSCIWLNAPALKKFFEESGDLVVPLSRQLLQYEF